MRMTQQPFGWPFCPYLFYTVTMSWRTRVSPIMVDRPCIGCAEKWKLVLQNQNHGLKNSWSSLIGCGDGVYDDT